jgi:hypothetical protein
MNGNRLLTLKGINYWYLAAAIGINVLWSLSLALVVSILFLKQVQAGAAMVQILLIVAAFAGPFLVGWLTGRMAGDGRGPSYGVYGSLGSVMILLLLALPTGLLGIMMIMVSIAGGLNGGLFSLHGRYPRR